MTLSTPSSGHAPGLPAVTPVLRIYAEIQAIEALFNDKQRPIVGKDEEGDRLYAALTDAEWRLTEEPATCMADLAAKVLQLTSIRDEAGTIFEPDLRDEMEAILAGGAA